jgi:hypothetical protein
MSKLAASNSILALVVCVLAGSNESCAVNQLDFAPRLSRDKRDLAALVVDLLRIRGNRRRERCYGCGRMT